MEKRERRERSKAGILDSIQYAMARSNELTEDELYMLHAASLDVLMEVGVKVESEEARALFAEGGCIVEGEIVKIPAHIVEESIRTAPSVVLLAGRNPKDDYVIKQKKVSFINFGEGVNVIDPYTKEYRRSVKADLERNTRVIDALNVLPCAYRSVASQDKAGSVQALHNMEAMFHNTTKHCFIGPDGKSNIEKIIDMAAFLAGGREALKKRPLVTFNLCPTSPLQLNPTATDALILGARAGIPCNIISMALSGATSSVTLAGTLVTHNAEVLSAVVLSQLAEKGAAVLYASSTSIMDMRHLTTPVGAPELCMISNAVAQLSRYYNLPSFVAGG